MLYYLTSAVSIITSTKCTPRALQRYTGTVSNISAALMVMENCMDHVHACLTSHSVMCIHAVAQVRDLRYKTYRPSVLGSTKTAVNHADTDHQHLYTELYSH